MRAALVLAGLAACSPSERAALPPEPDAPPCETSAQFTPVRLTGSSPGGTLDDFRFAYATFVGGFCPASYRIHFSPTAEDPTCAAVQPVMDVFIHDPDIGSGSHSAYAFYVGARTWETAAVTFEATVLDPPEAASPRIVGRLVSHDSSWTFDLAIDLTSQGAISCL